MINNLGTQLSELHINFGVLQIDTENSAGLKALVAQLDKKKKSCL